MIAGLIKHCLLIVYLCSCASATAAQKLVTPQAWQNPSSNISRQTRESLAYNAALPLSQMAITLTNPGLPYAQDVISVYALLSLQDYYSGNQTWRSIGTDGLQALVQEKGFWAGSNGIEDSDPTYLGLTLFYAYRTYKEPALLDNAVTAWNLIYYGAFISPSDAASGRGAGRSISFLPPANCTNGTFAGGVFRSYSTVPTDTYVNMVSIGPFMTLSVYLFEETRNTTYQQIAQMSLDFVINYLWDGSIVYDGLNLASCEITIKPFSINQAWFVESLSVWANITKNDTLSSFLESVVSSITTFSSWSLPDGVLNDSDPGLVGADQILKGIYMRGLAEARMRNPGTDLARYVEAYITVQFNALLDNARAVAPNDSYYSVSWAGPRATSFDAGGTIAALDVLNAAFNLAAPSASNATSSSSGHSTIGSPTSMPTGVSSHTLAKPSKTGAIAGGVIGGVVAAIALAAAGWCYRRRRVRPHEVDDTAGTHSLEPFVSRIAYNPPASGKLERTNEAYWGSTPSHSGLPLVASTSITTGDQHFEHDSIEAAEIPSLVQRLNNLLQGRHGELPPRYDE